MSAKTSETETVKAESPGPNDVVSVSEAGWTVQEPLAVVVDRPQDWTTQDYENNPTPRVTWEHPFDSI